jgi:hypothetical protein
MQFVVEMDECGTFTQYFEVEADSREEAIKKVADGKVEACDTEFHGYGVVKYDDTHEVEKTLDKPPTT